MNVKELKRTVVINQSAQMVFDFTINSENTPLWVDGVVSEQTNEKPTKIGTIYKNQDHAGNWRAFEITAFKSGVMFEMTKKDDNHHVRYTFKPLGNNQCELEYYVHADGDELRGAFTNQTVLNILNKLKTVIESKD